MTWIGWLIDRTIFYLGRIRSRYQRGKLKQCGKQVYIGNGCHLNGSNIQVGDNVYIGDGCFFLSTRANIMIGNNVMIGPQVNIVTGTHRIDVLGALMIDVHDTEKKPTDDQDVTIEDDVWIGMRSIILRGVRVGRGSVIGAGTLITKDVPPYTIVTNKREVSVKERFSPQQLALHEELLSKKKIKKG